MSQAMTHEPPGRHQSRIAAASGWIGSALEYLRLLHLRDRRVADLSADVFPLQQSDRRHRRVPGDLWGRLRRPADRRDRARPLGGPARTQERAARVSVPDGRLDDGGRAAADISAGGRLGADPPRDPAADPGLCGRGRNIGGELDDPRARAFRPARLFRELHAAGRAGGTNPGGGGFPASKLRAVESTSSSPGGGACRSCSASSSSSPVT